MSIQRKPKKLGDALVDSGLITAVQLQEALKYQKETGDRLGQILVNLGFVSEQDIVGILENQLGIPQITFDPSNLNANLVNSVPEAMIKRHRVMPIKKEGNRLTVAMVDPLNVVAIDDLRLTTGCEIRPVLATEKEIETAIHKHFGLPSLEVAMKDFEVTPGSEVENDAVRLDQEEAIIDEAPIVRLVNGIFMEAINEGVSDIHFEPMEDRVRIRYRADGILREAMKLPRKSRAALISRIKIMSDMDIAEKRVPQDGRIQIKYGEKGVDMRVNTLPTVFGEKIVIRLLDKSSIRIRVNQLGLSKLNHHKFTSAIRNPHGILLITGPTGSGKTTTLYATLNELNDPEKNIITVEDPVEYMLEGINQTQVNAKAGLTFAAGLRAILRQDPDIVMVGEIRDGETADIAVRAATTGHLVLSTLHTNDAPGAMTRLIDMGVEPFLVASSVIAVVAQRLVRRICSECKEAYELPPEAPERIYLGIPPEQITFYRGKGCSKCGNKGYKGRLGIHELMPITKGLRHLINARVSADEIKRVAVAEGMVTVKEDGLNKAIEGLTTVQEVTRVAYSEDE